jgi:hypothetical protein
VQTRQQFTRALYSESRACITHGWPSISRASLSSPPWQPPRAPRPPWTTGQPGRLSAETPRRPRSARMYCISGVVFMYWTQGCGPSHMAAYTIRGHAFGPAKPHSRAFGSTMATKHFRSPCNVAPSASAQIAPPPPPSIRGRGTGDTPGPRPAAGAVRPPSTAPQTAASSAAAPRRTPRA